MHLHEVDGEVHESEIAIQTAREIADIIRLWIHQLNVEEFKEAQHPKTSSSNSHSNGNGNGNGNTNSISSNRHKIGLGAPYILNPWIWTVERLIQASRVLKCRGRLTEAQACSDDAAMIQDGLKSLGVVDQLK